MEDTYLSTFQALGGFGLLLGTQVEAGVDRQVAGDGLVTELAGQLAADRVEVVKRGTGRERPEVGKGATIFHGPSKWDDGGDFQSFPSGHTAIAVVIMVGLALLVGSWGPFARALRRPPARAL